MKQKTRTKALSWLLTLAMVIGLVPGMSLTAYATTGAYNSWIPTDSDDATTLANKAVKFNGLDWYIIADNSTAVNAGTLTLLAKDPIGASKFHDSSNTYSNSEVKKYLDDLTATGSFASVANAINTVTLTTKAYSSDETYDSVGNVKLYLLSTSDAQGLPVNVRICSQEKADFWWLRSPGLNDSRAACVGCDDGHVDGTGYDVMDYSYGMRPALQINLSSVIFSSTSKTFEKKTTVAVTGVTLDKTSSTLTVGGTETLTATVAPDDATDKSVTWESSDTSVATVADGVVTAVAAGTANITVTTTDGSKTATCTVTVEEPVSTYTITIPATLDVQNAGWNDAGGISATGTLASGKKLTVTATSANNWALKSGDISVGYKLATASTDTEATTTWEFDSLSSTATTKPMGIVVDDYTNAAAGTYTDTVTFTAKMENAKAAAETPSIAQAGCTFSPTNGTSTLSNANITTSMEYSTDSGTTWTDVTTAGSIASLAAGTVQIRVRETNEKLASEAVSITVPQVLKINELVGPYSGDKLTPEYYAGETWEALVSRYDLIKSYSNHAAFGSDGFIYDENGSSVPVTDAVDNTKTYEVQ